MSVLANTLLQYFVVRFNMQRFDVIGYANPLVVMGAAGLLLWTAQLKIRHSGFINFTAASSFAVFLLHANPNIGDPIYRPFMASLYEKYDGLLYLAVTLLALVCIFTMAVVLDQPRKWFWNWMWNWLEKGDNNSKR